MVDDDDPVLVAQMDAADRLGVAIRRLQKREAEIERLRAENAKLRKLIQGALNGKADAWWLVDARRALTEKE